MDKFCDDEGQHFTTRIDILNNKEERIHNCVSTLKLSPSHKRFIIRTISSSIDKISYTKQEKEQELFYKGYKYFLSILTKSTSDFLIRN